METPRARVKNLVRGRAPARPLFVPIVFSLAAKLEGLDPEEFLANPTKLSNLLRALHHRLRTDGVTCHYDLTTAERVAVGLEVVRRLRATLRDEPALVVGLPGPVLTGRQLHGAGFLDVLSAGNTSALSALDELARLAREHAQAFCEAGADVVLVVEPSVPSDTLPVWAEVLSPLWNVVRFHESLPVIYTDSTEVAALARPALPCLPVQALPEAAGLALFSVALPLGGGQVSLPETRDGCCVLITTEGEIPYTRDIRGLEELITNLRPSER